MQLGHAGESQGGAKRGGAFTIVGLLTTNGLHEYFVPRVCGTPQPQTRTPLWDTSTTMARANPARELAIRLATRYVYRPARPRQR